MKKLIVTLVLIGTASLPAFAQQENMNSGEMAKPTDVSNMPALPTAQGGMSDQGYGMSTSGTSQSGKVKNYQLTPEQQDLYKGQ